MGERKGKPARMLTLAETRARDWWTLPQYQAPRIAYADRPVPPCPRCGMPEHSGSLTVGASFVACRCGKIYAR